MKKILLFIFIISQTFFGQELIIGNGTQIVINSGVSLNVMGLELKPSVDYDMIGPNDLSYSGTSIDVNGNPSINRVHTSTNPYNNYEGEIILHYQDGELNGLTEADLFLAVQDNVDAWTTEMSTIDTGANTITYDFLTATNFKGITASEDIPLSIEDINGNMIEILIYPNPVTSKLFVKSKMDLHYELFDLLGKLVLKTDNPNIDLSHLNSAMYILKVTDETSSKSNSYKIIKK